MDDFDLYRLFKTLHVIAVIVLGGGFVLEGIVGSLLPKVRTVQEARAYALLLYISENFLSIPAAIILAVFGYLTADRIGYDLDLTWLLLGQVGFYAIVILALAILRPASNRLYRMTREAPDGPLTPEITEHMKSVGPMIVGPVTTVIFVAVVYLMVSKPNW
jgi:uncharacterized membrane protein